jgi:hypothetical protein
MPPSFAVQSPTSKRHWYNHQKKFLHEPVRWTFLRPCPLSVFDPNTNFLTGSSAGPFSEAEHNSSGPKTNSFGDRTNSSMTKKNFSEARNNSSGAKNNPFGAKNNSSVARNNSSVARNNFFGAKNNFSKGKKNSSGALKYFVAITTFYIDWILNPKTKALLYK